jgi:hypothetical protein
MREALRAKPVRQAVASRRIPLTINKLRKRVLPPWTGLEGGGESPYHP